MTSLAFQSALAFILRWEGGFVDDPADPGGRTNRGVTQSTYHSWRTRQGLPQRDVKELDDTEVAAIYSNDYWLPPRCNLLRSPLDLVVFDTAVNMGVRRSIRILQTALSCAVDGTFGPATTARAAECDLGEAVAQYCRIREGIYRSLATKSPPLAKFLKGWLNRLNALRKVAGLPGFEATVELEAGHFGPVGRIADLAADQPLDDWR